MRIGITGATGFLGRAITRLAHQRGHEVIAFSRTPQRVIEWAVETRRFDLAEPPDLSGCEAVVHLAGEPILGLWTAEKKRAIVESRVQGTRRVVEAIERMVEKPEVFLSGSAIGFYGHRADDELTEESPQGTGFLAETTAAWEQEARSASIERVVCLRTGLVLGRGSGALRVMTPVFRCGLGGVIGSGRQWMSWIHLEDLARLALFCIEDMNVSGAVNACAPWPVPHRDFVATLARVLRRPAIFRAPEFAVRFALRGLAEELLESKRVLPAAALEFGFGFKFPELEPALRELLA
jgi:hypothetical protein